jgi:phosphatidyl-myo-inositol alpha-mannosyltransferase
MKILLSTPFDFSYPGGVNAHIHNLARELQRLGHATRILSPGAPDGTISDDGHVCRIGRAYSIRANGSLARLALSPFLGDLVADFLEQERFDVIHMHDPLTSTLHLTVLAKKRIPVVGTFHATNTSYLGYNLLYRIGKPAFSWFSQRIDYRIAVSPPARDFISYYFAGDYHLIPNGIDFDRFGPHVCPVPDLNSDHPTVLFVGRFEEPRKGFRYLLDAMARIQDVIPESRLLVVGPGNERAFSKQIARRRLRNVHFLGEVSADELPGLYASCDLFCAPSTGRESFGIVLLEAMASAKPVVASSIDGYRSVTRNGEDALLVEPCNPSVLASAILTVLQDRELAGQLSQAARERARICSWNRITQHIVECYEHARTSVGEEQPPLAQSSSLFSSTRRP